MLVGKRGNWRLSIKYLFFNISVLHILQEEAVMKMLHLYS